MEEVLEMFQGVDKMCISLIFHVTDTSIAALYRLSAMNV